MSRHTISLENFADWRGEVNGVIIAANLPLEPYVPSDEIQVDLGRISRAASLGRLGRIGFGRYYERDSITPGVNSISKDGDATAIFSASASKAPRIDSENLFSGSPLMHKGMGLVKINFGHKDLEDINLREAGPWADHINKSIGEGIRSCSKEQLLRNKFMRLGYLGVNACSVYTMTELVGPPITSTGEALSLYLGAVLGYNVISTLFKSQYIELERTMIPYLPYDRLAAVQIYTRTRKFAKNP